jgi:glucan endo-1,3-alpha-glucosidase
MVVSTTTRTTVSIQSVTTTATATATLTTAIKQVCSASPTVTPLYGGVGSYQGCYNSTSSPILSGSTTIDAANMNQEDCIELCSYSGYTYAGLTNGTTCLCGNSLLGTTALQCESLCTSGCAGNIAQSCGGPNGMNSIYAVQCGTTTYSPAPPLAAVGYLYSYVGCYSDPINSRALNATSNTNAGSALTVEYCIGTVCAGYQYAGLENGRECWCGNTFQGGAAPFCANSHCNDPCPGQVLKHLVSCARSLMADVIRRQCNRELRRRERAECIPEYDVG